MRPEPHIKHVHTDQGLHREAAQRAGFDDAVLTTADDRVSETTMANIGFFDETGVVWPDAPMLDGITKQLLERHAADAGVTMRERPVHLAELATMTGAFVSSARGIGLVSTIDAGSLTYSAYAPSTIVSMIVVQRFSCWCRQ